MQGASRITDSVEQQKKAPTGVTKGTKQPESIQKLEKLL